MSQGHGRTRPYVTAIVLNYQRPNNVVQLLDALHAQYPPIDILLVNNADLETFGERAVFIPWNAGPFIRFPFALYTETEWVMFIDDDLMPGDDILVQDALSMAKDQPGVITGAYGRRFSRHRPHYASDAAGYVGIVKGRFMIMRRELLARVRMPVYPPQFPVMLNDDIYVSLEIGEGEPVHWASTGLARRLVNLPEEESSLSYRPGHMEEREAFCRWYVKEKMR